MNTRALAVHMAAATPLRRKPHRAVWCAIWIIVLAWVAGRWL